MSGDDLSGAARGGGAAHDHIRDITESQYIAFLGRFGILDFETVVS